MADEQQVCPNCGNFNRAGARFCSKCGHVFNPSVVTTSPPTPAPASTPSSVPAPKPAAAPAPSSGTILCSNCGKEVGSDTRFCRHCGQPLGTAQSIESSGAASRATLSAAVSNMNVATSDDDMTQPLSVKPTPSHPPTPVKTAPRLPAGAELGAPAWLWALVGLLLGVLLGAGIVLAAPGFVGLERIAAPDAAATDAVTPAPPSFTDAATPLNLATATSDVAATATPEPLPTATSTATPPPTATPTTETAPASAAPSDEDVAPPADAPAETIETIEAVVAPADNATPGILLTSTPLAP